MNTLGMFARRPEAGKTKTRLAATIGDESAAAIYAAFVEDVIARCGPLADQFVVAATPEDSPTKDWFEPRLPEQDQLWFQPDGDLGEKIEWFFNRAESGAGNKVVLIGSDSPDLPNEIVSAAFQQLNGADVVISPATDGGFVLIGLSVPPRDLFSCIRWSSPATLSDVLNACDDHGYRVGLLPLWYDIDTVENLGTLAALQETTAPNASSARCPKTSAVLKLVSSHLTPPPS